MTNDQTITIPQSERAGYQRAIESAKDRIALLARERDEARSKAENAESARLWAAAKDAEDTQRLQAYCARLLAELEAARAFIREIRGAMLIGGWRDTQSALLAAYDAAVKARGE